MKVQDIIKDEIREFKLNEIAELLEGVADRYAEKQFGIPDPNKELNQRALQGQEKSDPMGTYVTSIIKGNVNQSDIYLDPKSLRDFEPQVRAISNKQNQLFVAQSDGEFLHYTMGFPIQKAGYDIGTHSYDDENNITWIRVKATQIFGLAESMESYYMKDDSKYQDVVERTAELQASHPEFKFVPQIYWTLDDSGNPKADEQLNEAIVERSVDEIIEGVADRYAEKNFNIPDPNTQMNQRAVAGLPKDLENGKLIGVMPTYDHGQYIDVNIFLNPVTLKDFDADVKAVSTKDGDLLIAELDLSFYHSDLTSNVRAKKIYNKKLFNAYDESENITWHRIGKTNDFGWSVSYREFGNDPENQQEVREHTDAVKRKNPNYNFIGEYWEEVKLGRNPDDQNNQDLYNGPASSYPIYSNMPHNQNR